MFMEKPGESMTYRVLKPTIRKDSTSREIPSCPNRKTSTVSGGKFISGTHQMTAGASGETHFYGGCRGRCGQQTPGSRPVEREMGNG